MKHIVILGAGTAGTMLANHLSRKLPKDWDVCVIDPDQTHLYQPGLLFLPFGATDETKMQRPRSRTLRADVKWIKEEVALVDHQNNRVELKNAEQVDYDLLVIASGAQIRPEETDGLRGEQWQKSIFDFYTLDGAQKLRKAMADFDGGRLVVNVVENPIKCPIAPLEFLFLADAFFEKRGIRESVELVFATPLDGAFTRPVASMILADMLERKGIAVEADFGASEVDLAKKNLVSYDERAIPFDLLVTIPTHMGADFIEASGLGDELQFVPTDKNTLQVVDHPNIFAIGDATDLPTSKAGSVAHFQAEILLENLLAVVAGSEPKGSFDGHANCFIESGYGKALLLDFNYEVEPLPGYFPVPGAFSLLKETRRNHWGKLAFRWAYWNMMLPGRKLPVSATMTMRGKRRPKDSHAAQQA